MNNSSFSPRPFEALPEAVVDRFPCTQSQQRFWILEQISPGNSSANVALCWELRGAFQAESIEAAYREVIARHEILRTRFVEDGGLPVQEVVAHVAFKMSLVDLRTVPAGQVEARVAAISSGQATAPFDLSRPGLIRATMLQLAADRALLLTCVHHMCFDGYSIRVLGREIGEIASAIDAGRQPDLAELELQYGDFALWQKDYLASADFETERRYWLTKLAGAPYFEVPTSKPRGAERSHAGKITARLLPPAVSERIDSLARSAGVSVFSLSAAILTAVLHRWTDKRDISIGTQVASREDSALENLIGVFINNIVLRFPIDPEDTFKALLERSSMTVQEALLHQRMHFNTLVELLNPPRDPARTPLISVNMIVQRAFMEDRRYGHFDLVGRPSSAPGALFDLNFMMIGRPEGWRTSLEYNLDLFEADVANALLADWAEAIERLTDDPAMRISDLPAARRRPEDAVASPASVEECLLTHPHVAAAAVTDLPEGGREARVIPSSSFAGALEELPVQLKAHLAARMATASVPCSIRLMMQLPGSASAATVNTSAAYADAAGLASIEATVTTLWCELLGLETVDRDANFFDLGGHSLLAVRFIAQLRERLHIKAGTSILYRAPTIATLVPLLAASTPLQPATPPQEDNRINVINPHAPGIPILSINNYSMIYAISKHFTAPRRCISIRLVDPDAPFKRREQSFDAIAESYVELVRQAQPHGPYALFGVCVHGNIALEVARRLMAEGDEVVGLFVKDVWAPAYSTHVRDHSLIRRLNKLHDLRVRLRKWRRGEISVFDLLRFYPRIRSLRFLQLLEAFIGNRLSQETRLLATTSQGDFIHFLAEARNRYTPEPYPGDMMMFATGDAPSGRLFDRTLGWKELVKGEMEVEEVEEIVVFRGTEIGTAVAAKKIEAKLKKAEAARVIRH